MRKTKKGGARTTTEKRQAIIGLDARAFYGGLAVLGIVAIFFVGIWLGRMYSTAGGPGVSIIRQLRLSQSQPQAPTPPALPTAQSYASVPRITPEEVKKKLDNGADVVIVDVRDKEAFDESHIKQAVSIPLSEMEARYEELPTDRETIIYGGHC